MEAHYLGSTNTHSLIEFNRIAYVAMRRERERIRGYRRHKVLKEGRAGFLKGETRG